MTRPAEPARCWWTAFPCCPAPCSPPVAKEQEITTIEGVSEHGSLAAIQKAYGDWGGAQCGYLHSGLHHDGEASAGRESRTGEEDIRSALCSNLCRCTGYNQMYQAIKAAIDAEKRGLQVVGDRS